MVHYHRQFTGFSVIAKQLHNLIAVFLHLRVEQIQVPILDIQHCIAVVQCGQLPQFSGGQLIAEVAILLHIVCGLHCLQIQPITVHVSIGADDRSIYTNLISLRVSLLPI